MGSAKYSVNSHQLEIIFSWIKSNEIAIPEIQRPFVWSSTKVRDLIDSLYQGYPIGYLITWKNPNVKLKKGGNSEGKKILIDGQQRVTALTAAILGEQVLNAEYKKINIKIAFNPLKEKFEVLNPAIAKDSEWIPDISPIIKGDIRITKVIKDYCNKNPSSDSGKIEDTLMNLMDIQKKQIGLIELGHKLDIETVTEIFIRINSKGVELSQADFAMSKIAANEEYNGPQIRKAIDYFCHLSIAPEFYKTLKESDEEFSNTDFFQKMSWLKTENDDLYDPDYKDLIRVVFTYKFNRGKLSDFVSLLSGRNFEKRIFEEEVAEKSFGILKEGILEFINETNFKRFLMIINSAGFIDSNLIRSQNVLNFAYILYLKLKEQGYDSKDIEKYVRRWCVMSILTGRYSGSPESKFDFDIKKISEGKIEDFLKEVEEAELSDAFWDASLIQSLDTSVASSPYFNVFLASQVKGNDKGFLSKEITVRDMVSHRGDVHHVFPKEFLKKQGLARGQYNQIANYVFLQQEINIQIGKKNPVDYFKDVLKQVSGGKRKYGGIESKEDLLKNFKQNCIPKELLEKEMSYKDFLESRRKLIAQKIKKYYFKL
ncbi:MAG: DUF262 domain-containing protein [archaeon]